MYEEIKKDKALWDLFTKKEEYNPLKLDKYGRFPHTASNHKNVLNPSVSEYLIQQGFHAEYPNNKKFAVVLTHDVDDIYISPQHILRALVLSPAHKDLWGFAKFYKTKLAEKHSPYINFKNIIQLEQKYEATSSFYFLASEKDVFGEKYQLEDIQDEISFILEQDCEVGLHTGYHAFNKLNLIQLEKKQLEQVTGQKIVGVRNHLLQFTIPTSWELLAQAGFEYDTSFAYHDMIGFRNGMCHPFQPFNLHQKKHVDILEIPLVVSDGTLFFYMNKGAKEAWSYIKNIIDSVEKLEGVLTILWHNWTFSLPVSYAGLYGKEWTLLYEKILRYCVGKNAWITNGKSICEYWKRYGLLKKM
jgi:hypothetical protein